jgi:hypothetical protein
VTERPEPGASAGGLTPDEVEQRQRPDGEIDLSGAVGDEVPEGPIDADVLEQQQLVDTADDDEAPRPE